MRQLKKELEIKKDRKPKNDRRRDNYFYKINDIAIGNEEE